ncbi:MAG: hypothetical protein H7X93_05810 [Sphingomonadaceae bacterium]|nr:hypothetical protein [Sphingomonadaceae bacterium]
MVIEFVDPDAIDKEPNSHNGGPKLEREIEVRDVPFDRPKRLVDVDQRLERALSQLERQIDRLHELNIRLFGASKPTMEKKKNSAQQNRGLLASIDERVGEIEALLAKLDEEAGAIDTLT